MEIMLAEDCPRCAGKPKAKCPDCRGLGKVCKPIPLETLLNCLSVHTGFGRMSSISINEELLNDWLLKQSLSKEGSAKDEAR